MLVEGYFWLLRHRNVVPAPVVTGMLTGSPLHGKTIAVRRSFVPGMLVVGKAHLL